MFKSVPMSLKIYMLIYSVIIIFCMILIIKNRREYNVFTKEYFRFIFTKERFIIYVLGTLALVIPVPFLKLHSWDYTIAFFQPVLAYLTSPWAVDIFCKIEKKTAKAGESFIAICMMLFTGSWAVEIYLLFRDGYYMPDWLINIPIGIVCYIVIGLIWLIEWNEDQEVKETE